MLAFIIRRLVEAAFVLLAVAALAFVLFRFVGDPVNQIAGQDTSLEDRLKLRVQLGLDDPIYEQFGRFVWKALHFDFGISYQFKQPVLSLLADRFPATMELALVAALFAVAGVAALMFSPLILLVGVVWLMVRLLRRRAPGQAPVHASVRAPAGATIAG